MNSPGPRAAGATAPRVNGKFLEVNGHRFLVKGVAYGTFAPDASGVQFPAASRIDEDFRLMAAAGINTVRTYTAPPDVLLDLAARHNLRVMAGLPWPQHVAFLNDAQLTREVRRQAAAQVARIAAHPAALLFALGNEIPPTIVRWHGQRRVERFLRDLYDEVKTAAPESLLTYVNFPPTEYLNVETFDVCAFNVYLHREADLRNYLARLQHIAGTRPLLLAEAGADSVREGLEGQADITAMHIRAAFSEGACGAVAFSWTDEWWRGGHTVEDWAFGLVDAARRPKPALAAVRQAFGDAPFPEDQRRRWPKVSVVVCAYNAADTIDECLTSLEALTYPNAEIILVNDGSRDATGDIARKHGRVQVVDVPNGGLSAARNVGLARATGDIVAYTDADVRVDPDWLTYLVQPILTSNVVGAGGPNIVPHDDPWKAQSVARAPGSPTHVMLDDRIAEHVPGCNMAFRRDVLLSIDGFNPVYLRAGDDVDICWRLQAKGLKVGFAPSALVWHHHRSSVKGYWRQQVGYGEGEAWLDAHHPEKFLGGQMLWRGRIYSPLPFLRSATGRRVNTGVWGTAAFPSVYSTQGHRLHFLPHSPAWMLASIALLLVGGVGRLLDMDAPWVLEAAGLAGCATTIVRCIMFAWRTDLRTLPPAGNRSARQSAWMYRGLIAWLHLSQPFARLRGHIRGLSSAPRALAPQHVMRHTWNAPVPRPRDAFAAARLLLGAGFERSFWSEAFASHTALLTELSGMVRAARPAPLVDVDEGWRQDRDLALAIGRWGWLQVSVLVEEHDKGRCLLRVGTRFRPSFIGTVQGLILALVIVGGTSAAMALYRPSVSVVVSVLAIGVIAARAAWQVARSAAVLDRAVLRVTTAAGMLPLPIPPGHGAPVNNAAEAARVQGTT